MDLLRIVLGDQAKRIASKMSFSLKAFSIFFLSSSVLSQFFLTALVISWLLDKRKSNSALIKLIIKYQL